MYRSWIKIIIKLLKLFVKNNNYKYAAQYSVYRKSYFIKQF